MMISFPRPKKIVFFLMIFFCSVLSHSIRGSDRLSTSSTYESKEYETKRYLLVSEGDIDGEKGRFFYINPFTASLIAGSIAGAIGVFVAFPLDTLKTKSQISRRESPQVFPFNEESVIANYGSTGIRTDPISSSKPKSSDMFHLIFEIYEKEGIGGFYQGVRGMMAGQAIIKSVAFSANILALRFIHKKLPFIHPVVALLCAAFFAGFVTAFLVAPIERIKIRMQTADKSTYQSEYHCLKIILRKEGFCGLFGRGLIATIAREVPSYGVYFLVYGLLMRQPIAKSFGGMAPVIFGALSGMASWLPVYPVDVVKTYLQNTEGDDKPAAFFHVVNQIHQEGGIGAFFDGLSPKMMRAAVNHSVTFYVYTVVMNFFTISVK